MGENTTRGSGLSSLALPCCGCNPICEKPWKNFPVKLAANPARGTNATATLAQNVWGHSFTQIFEEIPLLSHAYTSYEKNYPTQLFGDVIQGVCV